MNGIVSPDWWRPLFECIDPLRVTVVAPPKFIGDMLGAEIFESHSWAFDISLQAVYLQRNPGSGDSIDVTPVNSHIPSILSARPWTSLSFNEGSSLRAYNHYEYFLLQVPSVMAKWGTMALVPKSLKIPGMINVDGLTSSHYSAVFPFYNHVNLVLHVVSLMEDLETFSVRLAPLENETITEMEQRGSMDLSDPWMEIRTGYQLIAHTVRNLARRGRLQRFHSHDYARHVLRSEISEILEDVLLPDNWEHSGEGEWFQPASKSAPRLEAPFLDS